MKKFFCSDDELTIVDVQYYNSLQQICFLDPSRHIFDSRDFPEIGKWFKNVEDAFLKKAARLQSSTSILAEMNGNVKDIISHY